MHGTLNKRALFARMLRNEAPSDGGQGGNGATPPAETPPAVTPPANSQTTAPAWHESIEDEGLRKFIEGKGFKGAGDAAKALQDLEGKTAVPDSVDAYQLPVPEGQDKAFSQVAAGWMHKAGIPVAQAQTLAAAWNQHQAEQQQAADLARQQQGERDVSGLKKEWGGEYDANTELARRAVRTFGADEQTLEKISQALGDGETLRFFHRIGKHLGEGTLIPAGGERGNAQPADPEAARAARMFPSMKK
ncbi:hypothetical protein [Orrella dioscoreae]|uniref:hypothetical protein n=1 Tax=Orrella dioscoreae TaxID=1851544 RepID=UPI000AB99D77|nr:hypothetical protein [Orrella dioscoreae]